MEKTTKRELYQEIRLVNNRTKRNPAECEFDMHELDHNLERLMEIDKKMRELNGGKSLQTDANKWIPAYNNVNKKLKKVVAELKIY